jgi:hypothetical protein
VPANPPPVLIRPQLTRIIAWVAAAVFLLTSVWLAAALQGSLTGGRELVGPADRVAMVGLGVIAALAVLLFTRPLVEADADGLRVRNIVGGYQLGWGQVREVRFDRDSSWATLELYDHDVLAVLAVQAVDAERAVAAVRALRDLHAAHRDSDHPG